MPKIKEKNLSQEFHDRVCVGRGYKEQLEDEHGNSINNPETKVQFVDKEVEKFLRDSAKSGQYRLKREAENTVIDQEVDAYEIN